MRLAQHRIHQNGACICSPKISWDSMGFFLNHYYLCVDASGELHMVENKTAREKLEETFLRKAHSQWCQINKWLKYIQKEMRVFKVCRGTNL